MNRAAATLALLASLCATAEAAVHVVAPANPPSGTTFISDGVYSVSGDGRFVAFASRARNLLPGATPPSGRKAVYLRDRLMGTTLLVSHGAASDEPGARTSWGPTVSEDGSVVLYQSSSPIEGTGQQFHVYDRATGTRRPLPGMSEVSASADGSLLVATSTAAGESNVVLIDTSTGAARLISHRAGSPNEPAGASRSARVSADGRYVSFVSSSPSLVQGLGGSIGAGQVFLYDTVTSTCVLVSRAAQGGYPNAASGAPRTSRDGRFVAYTSSASNIVPGQVDATETSDLFLFDRLSLETRLVTHTAASFVTSAHSAQARLGTFEMSDDGSVLAFSTSAGNLAPGAVDTNGLQDVYVYENATGLLRLASGQPEFPSLSAPDGGRNPSMSGDGRLVAFETEFLLPELSRNEVSVFDRLTNVRRSLLSTRVPDVPPNSRSRRPVMARDGSFVVFWSYASNLTGDVPDFDYLSGSIDSGMTLYGTELPSNRLVAVSRAERPAPAAYFSETGLLSQDGSTTLFDALVGNVGSDPVGPAPEAWPGTTTTYVSDRRSGRIEALALRAPGIASQSLLHQISADGQIALFTSREGIAGTRPSRACALVTESTVTFGCYSLYQFDRLTGETTLVTHTGDPAERASGYGRTGWMSDDGSIIVFTTNGGELFERLGSLVLWERKTGALRPIPAPSGAWGVLLARSGRRLVYRSEEGLRLRDLESGELTLLYSGGSELSRASLSRDGDTVAFLTRPREPGSALLVFSHDSGQYERLPANALIPRPPSLSADGRFVVFGEEPSTLVLWDRLTSTRTEITTPDGSPPDVWESFALSADGSTVAFSTAALPYPASRPQQVVHWDRLHQRSVFASSTWKGGEPGNGLSRVRGLDEHGDRLLFYSTASNLGPADASASQPDPYAGTLYVFDAPPVVLGAAPPCAGAAGGDRVEVRGAHFQQGAQVRLAGVTASVVSVSTTSIIVSAGPRPPGKELRGDVEVQNPDGLTDRLTGAFLYALRGGADCR